MFGFLKYVIFAIGLLAAYVLVEHFIINRGENEQTIDETVNQAVSDVQKAGENVNEKYIRPTLQKVGASE